MTGPDLVLTPTGLRFGRDRFPCSIGRGGLRADKAEGDGATPIGTHRIVGLLYRPDRVQKPALWARPIGPGDLWSDAPEHADYNTQVRTPYAHSHEALRRADPLYDLILITDWNWPNATPYKGSAIFLHQWRRPGYPTEGCIALSRRSLHRLALNLEPGTKLHVFSF